MQTAERVFEVMQRLGEKNVSLTRFYRNLYNEDLYKKAYDRLYSNRGALTPGVTPETADGMSLEKIRRIIEKLRYERYRWSPVRRVYIERPDGRKRPLGLPTWSDKLVEEVIRSLLEAYYEPQFSDCSHGYRPGRGCHTALKQVRQTFKGANWLIEGDIHGCFDHIDHDKLLEILGRNIEDNRFLRLLKARLQSGILEDWRYNATYSGTPQGGVLSPLMANVYLNELDTFIETELLPDWNKGERRGRNPEYARLSNRKYMARKRGDWETVEACAKRMRELPSQNQRNPAYRRLKYVRYADDFILGFIGTKAEAQAILDAIEMFLETELHFQMSKSKSKITHAKTEHAVFLGYDISVYGNVAHYLSKRAGVKVRSANGRVRLGVPYGLPHEKAKQYQAKGKPQARYELEELPVAEIIECYQREFRGLVNYYQYAVDVCQLSTLKYVMEQSLVKTLARKLQISVSKVCERYKTTVEVDGRPYKVLEERVEGEQKTYVFRWGGIPLRRRNILDIPLVDETVKPWIGRTDLITRLEANTCEVCGRTGKCESHHVRKLKDVQRKWRGRKAKPKWVIQMMSLRRKTLIVCPECHRAIHQGTGRLKPKPDVVES